MRSIDNSLGRILKGIKARSLTICFGASQNTVSPPILAIVMSLHFQVQARELVDFWLNHFKAQLDARSAFMIVSKG
jgi:hypothetical protein